MHLEEIGLNPEASLTAAGTAYNQHILVPAVLGIRWSAGEHQAFRFGQDDVLLELGVHKRFDVLGVAP